MAVVDEQRVPRQRRGMRVGMLAGCGALVLAGCASMPDNGGLESVEASQRPDSQVRVFALPPKDDVGPSSIVEGFLEALTSDDPSYTMARKYLTSKAAKNWEPKRQTVVLDDGPSTRPTGRPNSGNDGRSYELTGKQVATVDQQQAYQPRGGAYQGDLHLTQVNTSKGKQWRIDALPEGVVLGESDFQRIYSSVNKYYYAVDSTSGGEAGQRRLVADPVFVRQWTDPLTETVKELLQGPTRWLNPVVRTAFPTHAALKKGTDSLAPDDANKLTVPLNEAGSRAGQAKCKEMAAQLLFSLRDLSSSSVNEVELKRSDGRFMCAMTEDGADALAAPRSTGRVPDQYFLDAKGRLVRMPGKSRSDKSPEQVPGPLGEGEQVLRSVAVSRDQERAAGVSNDGRSLYVASLIAGASLGDPVASSHAKAEKNGFTTPSWDGNGDLWVADRDPKHRRLLMFGQGQADKVQKVRVEGLGDDATIETVKASADGARIGLLVSEKDTTSLWIGRVERHADANGDTEVSVTELRQAAPQMEEVTAVSWAGDSRLVVVGREPGGLQQMQYVLSDGSTPTGQALPGLTRVSEIAASDNDELPLLAHSDDGIVRLPSGAAWQSVLKDGTAPVYPG
ncbi:LpqB family beta-propeller domain-containing protein [Streptomyces sp. NBC_00006]|uniref:LpqB family beta-propeller domain-containing protein n=1 Tax=Streptomyces sp. NBC_00006 TaxID=2975619 RepID=UPI00224F1EE0|nr:LpqB family beta-propeller domain-containing protein [Streptomyces sp. NBC_00006]MCX5533194.1 LpqB family beta-propeller domain-containing protein [Streptomyces sp. NBC_00006]